MVEYTSAAGSPLPGAYSAPQTRNWTKGEMEGKGGKGGRMGMGNEGRVGTGRGYRREEKGKRRERMRGDRCDTTFSSYIYQCLQNSFTL